MPNRIVALDLVLDSTGELMKTNWASFVKLFQKEPNFEKTIVRASDALANPMG
jgi:hypothetical protein